MMDAEILQLILIINAIIHIFQFYLLSMLRKNYFVFNN